MGELILAVAVLIVVVGSLIGWVFREDRRRRRTVTHKRQGVV